MASYHSGTMLNAVTPANVHLPSSLKGKGNSISSLQRRVHLSNLASVPDQDSTEMAWMENGYVDNGQFEEMQDPISEGCNSQMQLNYTSSYGYMGQEEMQDVMLPSSKAPAMLEVAVNGTYSSSVTAATAAGGQALPIKNFQEDEMISWLQDPPYESFDQLHYSGSSFLGELPDANVQAFTDSAFAAAGQGITAQSPQTQLTENSGNTATNYALVTRVSNAETAMTLAACQAAGLIRQSAGVDTFSYTRMPQLGTWQQHPRLPPPSSSLAGLGQGITEKQIPVRTSSSSSSLSTASGSLLAPMLPPKSTGLAAAATSNSFAHGQQVANTNTGAMNFPVFARPAALIKANLQSLNITSILPSNLIRFQQFQQQGIGHVNLDASTSTSSSITEMTTKGQSSSALEPRNEILGAQSELARMQQFQAAAGSHRSSNLGVDSLSQMPSPVSRKEVSAAVASAREAAMDHGSCEPIDQDTCHHSSGTAGGSAVVAASDLGASHTTEVQDPTITSASAGQAVQAATSDVGVLQGMTSVLEVAQESTITSAWGGGSSNVIALERAKETSPANKKKLLQGVEEIECQNGSQDGEDGSLDMKKPVRGSATKRNRAAEVHNLSERRRRDRINEKMKSLQELIPNSNKTDKASMLDEAIEYIKTLQLQLQMMSMRSGMTLPLMVLPPGIQHPQIPQMPKMPQMAMSIGVGMGMGMGMGMKMGSGMGMGAATGLGQQGVMMPMTSSAAAGPVTHNSNVAASMMTEARDSCNLVNPNMMDSCDIYLARQHHQTMQIQQQQQPMSMEMYNAYLLQRHQQQQQLQQQQQQQHYQLQQEHHQSFNMVAAGPPP